MQMTMMASPNINSELHYLNKEDRLLRWLVIKNRGTTFGNAPVGEHLITRELQNFRGVFNLGDMIGASIDDDDDDDEDDDPSESEV